jgi:electron transport complex protein RnfB
MLSAIVFMFALGLCLSLLLAFASRVFYVREDPRLQAIKDVLPGLNCGG